MKPRANTDMYAPYLEALSEVRLGLVDPNHVEMQRDDVAGFGAMFDEYRDKLHADGAIDHDEQIYGAVEALLRAPEVRRAFQRECRHLLVDEFQDLTPAQLLMLRLVGAPAYDVFGVGDDDQVIYGYAGADPEFLINYDRYFPGGTHHTLNTNYRCPARVVDGARNLLSYNRRRIEKAIVAAKPDDAGDTLTTTRAAPERLGLAAIEQATQWLANGAQPEELAVLARVNASLLPVQILFGEANVPCWTPVSTAVLNRTGTRTALAYLRLALAATTGMGLPGADLATAARRPSRSIRREILQRFERRRRWTVPQLRDSANGLNATAADKFETFLADLQALGQAIDDGATTDALLTRIRDDIGLGAALATLDLSGKGPDASHRDDLNALIAVATFEPDPAAFEPWLRTRLREPEPSPEHRGRRGFDRAPREGHGVAVRRRARRARRLDAARARRRPRRRTPHLPRRDHTRRHRRARRRRRQVACAVPRRTHRRRHPRTTSHPRRAARSRRSRSAPPLPISPRNSSRSSTRSRPGARSALRPTASPPTSC